MRGHRFINTLVGIIFSGLISSSAFAYYQDKFNPNSRTYQSSGRDYSDTYRVRSHYQESPVGFQETTYTSERAYGHRKKYKGMRTAASEQRRNYNFPGQREATGRRVFIYDPQQLTWAAYDSDGSLVRTGPGSSGRSYCSDLGRGCRTPSGTFRVFSKEGPSYKSKRFPLPRGGAPMMYAMFFHKGFAIHGSNDVPGYNASHGCVRVHPGDARWLNHEFLAYGSTVIIRPY